MNRVLMFLAPLVAATACTPTPTTSEPPPLTSETTSAPVPTTVAAPPPSPVPVADGPCPYLDNSVVAEANGQRVGKVRVSADKPQPGCFFYRLDGKIQLTVRIYSGDPKVAKALVDEAAPIATSNPAESPAGWKGGSLASDSGAVYAVAKAGTAVVVTTNQEQTIKARRVTETVIKNAGL